MSFWSLTQVRSGRVSEAVQFEPWRPLGHTALICSWVRAAYKFTDTSLTINPQRDASGHLYVSHVIIKRELTVIHSDHTALERANLCCFATNAYLSQGHGSECLH